jgi:hypothetical protein
MTWLITPGQPVPVVPVDPVFNNVSLLLHGDGTNGSTTITDNSPSPKTVTANGNAQISTAQSKFGGASIAFDGTGDDCRIESTTISNWFGTDLFTIEFWMRRLGDGFGGGAGILFDGILGGNLVANSVCGVYTRRTDRKISFFDGATLFETTSAITNNVWHHIAITRDGSNNLKVFIDGVAGATGSTSRNISGASLLYIGSDNTSAILASGNYYYNGYIDDLRITKGVARYTANFTPPTAAFPDI